MTRIFTFGCSYTSYLPWPTWANFLGLEYENYQHWGIPGLGCRGIAERVAECHARNNITSDDIVVVQWTSHLRHDYFRFLEDGQYHWRAAGSVFAEHNSQTFSLDWIEKFFDEPAYIMHSLNAMVSVISLLKSTGCKWYMTSIGDFTKLGSDLDNVRGDETIGNVLSIENNYPQFNFYVDHIWKDHATHWLKPIGTYAIENHDNEWRWRNSEGDLVLFDRHPSPTQHVGWLNTQLRPALGLGTPHKEQELWLQELARLKYTHINNLEMFYAAVNSSEFEFEFWPHNIWFRPAEGF